MQNKIKVFLRTLLYESAGKYALRKGFKKRFMNLGYKASSLDLKPGDQEEQLNFELYHIISEEVNFTDKSVLEIGCGRGGGCYFLKEYKKAGNVVGIDLSDSNIKLAKKLVNTSQTKFYRQNAEKTNLPPQSFDVLVNLESSHCYPDKPAFFKNVFNLLKPGGVFVYADIFMTENIPKIKFFLANLGFSLEQDKNITTGVLESLKGRPAEKISFLKKHIVPLFLKSFYGYEQSNIFKDLSSGKRTYQAFVFRKTEK